MKIEDVLFDELYITKHGSFCYLKTLLNTHMVFYLMYKQHSYNYSSHVQVINLAGDKLVQGVNENYWVRRIEL